MSNQQEELQMGEEKQPTGVGRLVFAGALGSLIGAGAAMLFSPWRGAEARLRLKYHVKEWGATAKQKTIGLCRRRRGLRKGMHTHA